MCINNELCITIKYPSSHISNCSASCCVPFGSLLQDRDIHFSRNYEYPLQMAHNWFTLDITLSLRKLPLPRSCSLLRSVHLQWLDHVSLWRPGSVPLIWENFEEPTFPINALGLVEASFVASESWFNFPLCPALLPSFPYWWCCNMSLWVQLLHANSYLRRCFWRPWSKSIGANSNPKKQTIKWDIGNGPTVNWPVLWIWLRRRNVDKPWHTKPMKLLNFYQKWTNGKKCIGGRTSQAFKKWKKSSHYNIQDQSTLIGYYLCTGKSKKKDRVWLINVLRQGMEITMSPWQIQRFLFFDATMQKNVKLSLRTELEE